MFFDYSMDVLEHQSTLEMGPCSCSGVCCFSGWPGARTTQVARHLGACWVVNCLPLVCALCRWSWFPSPNLLFRSSSVFVALSFSSGWSDMLLFFSFLESLLYLFLCNFYSWLCEVCSSWTFLPLFVYLVLFVNNIFLIIIYHFCLAIKKRFMERWIMIFL